MHPKFGFLLSAFLLIPLVHADETKPLGVRDQSNYVTVFGGRSLAILGTSDIRHGFGASYGYGRADRRLSFHNIPAQLVYDVYATFTSSQGINGDGKNQDWGIGAMANLRYRYPVNSRRGLYFDMGFGLHYVSQTSHDLNLNLNTTPTVALGTFFPFQGQELMLGARLLHISNGGRKKPNDGQNLFLFTVGVRL